MLLLGNPNADALELITSSAAAVAVHGSYTETDSTMGSASNVLPVPVNFQLASATTTSLIAAPGASKVRNLKFLQITNNDAALSCTVTVQITSTGPVHTVLKTVTLPPGESLVHVEGRWFHYDAGLGIYATPTYDPTIFKRSMSTADQTGLSAGSANYLTGSAIKLPASGSLVAGMVLRWLVHVAKTGAGTSTSQFAILFGTAGTTADTARCSTGALDTETAVADELVAIITATIRGPIGAACVVQSSWMLNDNLTTTGFSTTARKAQVKAVQSAAFDITPSGTIAGLTMTPGTADVITVRQVVGELLAPQA